VKQFADQERKQRRESNGSRRTAPSARPPEKGYILLTLLLVVAMMGIFALAAYTTIEFEIRRDQELEMIHRGVQYSRAIRAYYKKFQRYPTKLEDLDNTNNLRYLRKHYKDPLNKNQDFRLLHFGEQGVTLAGGLAGGSIPGASAIGSPAGLNGSGQGSSAFGGTGVGGSTFGNSGVNSSGVFAQSSSGLGANSNSQTPTGQQGTTPASGLDPTQTAAQLAGGTAQEATSSSSQPLIASGPIVGVASLSKKSTIREFNKKKKYNEWQFVYDPAFDRGGLITTPYQPSLANFGTGQNNLQPAGTTGSSSSQSGFGQSSFGQSSFGQSPSGQSGFGNNSSPAQPTQPATASPQQQ
jgi:type II secretory pathway pseudopilin PulG